MSSEPSNKRQRKRDWVYCDHCHREVSNSTYCRHKLFRRIDEAVIEDDTSSSSASEESFSGYHNVEEMEVAREHSCTEDMCKVSAVSV